MAENRSEQAADAFQVRIGWRRDDPRLAADAIAFWKRTGALPGDVRPEDRAREIVAAVYDGDKLIALATAHLEWIKELRARFVLVRALTDPEHRRRRAMWALALPVRETLERWAVEHPEEKVAGQLGYANAAWGELVKWPVAPGTGQIVAGYTAEGEQVRLRWYDHFRFEDSADDARSGSGDTEMRKVPMSESEAAALAPEYDIHPAWRRDNAQFEADAIAFWDRLGILPPDVTAEQRAKELAAVAYKDGKLVAVATIGLGEVKQVRARLGMLRAATDPEHRQTNVARALSVLTRALLERWAMEHPEEKVKGMGAVVQSEHLRGLEKQPVWPTTFLTLIGWTARDQQLRVTWFEDARLD